MQNGEGRESRCPHPRTCMPIAISFENSPRHEARPHPPINVASPALRMRHRMYSCTHFLHVILHLTAAYRTVCVGGLFEKPYGLRKSHVLFFLCSTFCTRCQALAICDVRSNSLRRSSRLAPKDMGFGFTDRAIWENLADD